jgi:hypothetical protein
MGLKNPLIYADFKMGVFICIYLRSKVRAKNPDFLEKSLNNRFFCLNFW